MSARSRAWPWFRSPKSLSPLAEALARAPVDDEPYTDEERAAVEQAREEMRRGEFVYQFAHVDGLPLTPVPHDVRHCDDPGCLVGTIVGRCRVCGAEGVWANDPCPGPSIPHVR